MNDYVSNFIEHGGQVDSFLASAVLWIGFAAIGSLFIARGEAREAAPFLGWSVVSVIFTGFGVLTKIPFTYLAIATAVLALVAGRYSMRREGGFLPAGMAKMAILAAPLLLLVSAMLGSQWDEFSDWLITPRLLLQTDAFPNRENVHLSGSLAAYPFGWHYVTYLASQLGGRFMENAGALVNVFMLLTFGLIAARLIGEGLRHDDQASAPGWGLVALGGLLATVLSTTFAQKVALTSYADVATAATLGVGGLFGWIMLGALAEGRDSEARRQAMHIGLLMMLLVNLKQSTVVLFLLLVGAIVLTGLRDPRIKWKNLVQSLPWMVVPPAIIFILWRYYITTELPRSEMNMLPFSEWLIAYIPDILQRMLLVLSKKGAYLALLIVIVGFGVRALLRLRTPFDRLALLVALVFLGHNAFLLFAYVTTFGKFDALRAASYWRYNMQLGMIGVVFMSYGAGLAWKNYLQGRFNIAKLGWIPVSLMLITPFIFANKLRFDRFQPIPHFRAVAVELNELLSKGDILTVLDPLGTGESAVIARYEMGGTEIYKSYLAVFHPLTVESVANHLLVGKYTHVLLHSVSPDVLGAVNMDLATGSSYLLENDAPGKWHVVRSWQVPVR